VLEWRTARLEQTARPTLEAVRRRRPALTLAVRCPGSMATGGADGLRKLGGSTGCSRCAEARHRGISGGAERKRMDGDLAECQRQLQRLWLPSWAGRAGPRVAGGSPGGPGLIATSRRQEGCPASCELLGPWGRLSRAAGGPRALKVAHRAKKLGPNERKGHRGGLAGGGLGSRISAHVHRSRRRTGPDSAWRAGPAGACLSSRPLINGCLSRWSGNWADPFEASQVGAGQARGAGQDGGDQLFRAKVTVDAGSCSPGEGGSSAAITSAVGQELWRWSEPLGWRPSRFTAARGNCSFAASRCHGRTGLLGSSAFGATGGHSRGSFGSFLVKVEEERRLRLNTMAQGRSSRFPKLSALARGLVQASG